MEVVPLLVFACMAVCFVPQVNSLQCFMCGDVGSPCGAANTPSRVCEGMENRCVTFVMKQGQMTNTMKNCTNSMGCPASSPGNVCFIMGLSPPNCTFTCCEGDLCNGAGGSSTPPPTDGVAEFTVTFSVVILSVLIAKVI
ncbi:uncharacterized protein [Montipora capricornis]|uniref:uncharacterized protein n=1 Tax=Montipora foliosa TaxID=591990 RepID=UPI0035F16F31